MTTIYSNNNLIDIVDNPSIKTISFNSLGQKIYSAIKIDKIYGVFISNSIWAGDSFVKWNKLAWTGTNNENTKVYFFVRSADTSDALLTTRWVGPYQNKTTDISNLTGTYCQFMVVLRNDADKTFNLPVVNNINLSFYSTGGSVKFFTKAFSVNFVPEHILLTYNASNVNDDTIIRFAVSGEDTLDTSRYQYVNPNKIEKLNLIGYDSSLVKIMIEFLGTSQTEISIDEFAVMFSGKTN